LERLAKAKLYGTLATTAPLYNISTLCNKIKNKTNEEIFRKARRVAYGSQVAVWPPLCYCVIVSMTHSLILLHCCLYIILLEVARELSHFCKMACRAKVVGPR